MALVNTTYQISTYIDDFGREVKNVPIKFGDGAPNAVLSQLYTPRTAEVSCGATNLFKLRRLRAVFIDGSTHEFPLPNRTPEAIEDALNLLLANEAACVSLIGEKWGLVPSTRFGGISFRGTPFTNIPSRGVKESVSYNYQSDFVGGVLRTSTSIEKAPTELADCQKSGLDNAVVEGGGICSAAGLGLAPRKYIIQALATKAGDPPDKIRRVTRQAIISERSSASIETAIAGIAPCAYCVGYQGESIDNLQLL